MKKLFPLVLCLLFTSSALAAPSLLYQGHGSLRITTADNKVIYIDPYAGDGYDLPADLIKSVIAEQIYPIMMPPTSSTAICLRRIL